MAVQTDTSPVAVRLAYRQKHWEVEPVHIVVTVVAPATGAAGTPLRVWGCFGTSTSCLRWNSPGDQPVTAAEIVLVLDSGIGLGTAQVHVHEELVGC